MVKRPKNVIDVSEFDRFVESVEKSKAFVFDFETDGLDSRVVTPEGLALYCPGIRGAETLKLWIAFVDGTMAKSQKWPVTDIEDLRGLLDRLFSNNSLYSIAHNWPYDARLVLRYGTLLRAKAADTMNAARLVRPERRQINLAGLAKTFLNRKVPKYKELLAKAKDLFAKGMSLGMYSMKQVELTWFLLQALMAEMNAIDSSGAMKRRFTNLDMPLVQYSTLLAHRGIHYDREALINMASDLEAQYVDARTDFFNRTGFDYEPSRHKKLGDFLYGEVGLPEFAGQKTNPRTTKRSHIERLEGRFPVIGDILNIQDLSKLSKSAAKARDAIISHERLHPEYEGHKHANSRFVCNRPIDLMSIPKGMGYRRFISADENHKLISFDYKAFGLKVLAALSGDERLKEFCRGDAHQKLADRLNVTRDDAKIINSSIMLGKGAEALALDMGLVDEAGNIDVKEGARLQRTWYASFPKVGKFFNVAFDEFCETFQLYDQLGGLFDKKKHKYAAKGRGKDVARGFENSLRSFAVNSVASHIFKTVLLQVFRLSYKHHFDVIMHCNDCIYIQVKEERVDEVRALVKNTMMTPEYLLTDSVLVDIEFNLDVEVKIGDDYSQV